MPGLRPRNSALTFKLEAVEGVPENPSAATDAVLAENIRLSFPTQLVETNEVTGSLDSRSPIVGGVRATASFDVYIKGSGVAATPPEYGDLLKVCGFAEQITAAAVPAAPEACAAGGSAFLAVLGASASAVAQTYRGMPILFTGAVAGTSFITDYTAAKQATLADTMAAAIVATTNYQIPANVLYRPASAAIPSGTLGFHLDGVKYTLAGCRGSARLALPAGQAPKLSFELSGFFVTKIDAAVPGAVYDSTRPPIFKGGVMSIGRLAAALASVEMDLGNALTNPANPNAAVGFDAAVITARRISGTMDPLATLVATRDLIADLRSGTQRIIHGRMGAVAGNRVGLTVPQGFFSTVDPGDRDGLATDQVQFRATGEDAGLFLCLY